MNPTAYQAESAQCLSLGLVHKPPTSRHPLQQPRASGYIMKLHVHSRTRMNERCRIAEQINPVDSVNSNPKQDLSLIKRRYSMHAFAPSAYFYCYISKLTSTYLKIQLDQYQAPAMAKSHRSRTQAKSRRASRARRARKQTRADLNPPPSSSAPLISTSPPVSPSLGVEFDLPPGADDSRNRT